MTGVNARHSWQTQFFGRESEHQVGVQFQNDDIHNGLLATLARETISTTRRDHIVQTSVGAWFQNATEWSKTFRTVAGVRADRYCFDVTSDLAANSGVTSATKISPKLNLIFGPWGQTELYANLGTGFHSNDARGTVITIDPKTGDPAERVTPLVRSKGFELGARTSPIAGLQTSLALYRLDFASELLFVGDAGTTEAGRPSKRTDFELANYYRLDDWLTIDADLAFAKARFKDAAPEGRRILGAVEGVASVAVAVDNLGPWFGAVQARWFGPRPLIEDNSVRSSSSATLSGRIGYKIGPNLQVELEGFNLTNRKVSAIDYFYTSRLPGETPEGVDDIHFHPIESRSFRVTLVARF